MNCPAIVNVIDILIKKHDVFFEYSEDMRYVNKGYKEQKKILDLLVYLDDTEKSKIIDRLPIQVRKNWESK